MLTTVQKANTKPVGVSAAHPGAPGRPHPTLNHRGRHLWALNCAGGARAALAGKPSRSAGFKKN